jgi:putative sterol carrier protein
MNVEPLFEEIFIYYRADPTIQAMFEDQKLIIGIKFRDTKESYYIEIDQNKSISLLQSKSTSKPDVRISIQSKSLLSDLLDGKIPLKKQFLNGKIRITKGLVKISKIYRKYVKND